MHRLYASLDYFIEVLLKFSNEDAVFIPEAYETISSKYIE